MGFFNLLVIDHLIPGAIMALVLAWLLASWSTRHFAVQEAHRHADSLQLVDDDRKHFLEWKLTEMLEAAEEKIVPMTVVYFLGFILLFLSTGLLSCGGPKEQNQEQQKPNVPPGVQDAVILESQRPT